jgi:hypothetical protein
MPGSTAEQTCAIALRMFGRAEPQENRNVHIGITRLGKR